MTATHSQFAREIIETLPREERIERIERLSQLEAELSERLKDRSQWNEYWQEVKLIISELKAVGHDLWSHDYDGERRHLWGWDYMHPETAGFLQIRFDFEGSVKTFWSTENPQVLADDEA